MKSNIISSYIGAFLRRARKEKSMTGKQLAKLMNVSQQQISRYETGNTAITLDQLSKFLTILDKRWGDVFLFLESNAILEKKIGIEKENYESQNEYILFKDYSKKNFINNI